MRCVCESSAVDRVGQRFQNCALRRCAIDADAEPLLVNPHRDHRLLDMHRKPDDRMTGKNRCRRQSMTSVTHDDRTACQRRIDRDRLRRKANVLRLQIGKIARSEIADMHQRR